MILSGTSKWGIEKSYKGKFRDDNLITLQEFLDVFIEYDDEKLVKYFKVSLVDTIDKNAITEIRLM